MIRTVVFVFAFVLAAGSTKLSASGAPEMSLAPIVHPAENNSDAILKTTKKKNKDNQLQKELEKAAEPLIVLKRAIETHLPQRELNTIRQMAFRIFLIARRYL